MNTMNHTTQGAALTEDQRREQRYYAALEKLQQERKRYGLEPATVAPLKPGKCIPLWRIVELENMADDAHWEAATRYADRLAEEGKV